MKGCVNWNYAPYRPLMFDTGDLYLCRLAPAADSFACEWLPCGAERYDVYVRRRGRGEFELAAQTAGTCAAVSGLEKDCEYECFVAAGQRKSRVRLIRTGETPGTVVNYLHPEDGAYAFSGHALCSPSLLRLEDGTLLASMDVYEGKAPQNLTLIFRSEDQGKTWKYHTELFPCFWGKLFLHKGAVYMLAVSTEYGDLLIGRSDDGGKTFGAPVVLLRGSCHFGRPGVHKNPQNVVRCRGRIYETLEWGCWAGGTGHAAMVMSCDENADLLNPENWHFTPPVPYNPDWPGTASGPSTGNIEGTLVVFPDGKLYNVMRYGIGDAVPSYGLVLAYLVNTEDPDAPLTYSHAIELPGNHSKFMIRQDPQTGRYYTIISRITSHETRNARNLLSLMTSEDAEHWTLVCDLIDRRDDDPALVGFQYVDFDFDGDDLIYLCRTAMNGAFNSHDANYSTFHRVERFREM